LTAPYKPQKMKLYFEVDSEYFPGTPN